MNKLNLKTEEVRATEDFCGQWVKRPLDFPELPDDKAVACVVHLQPGQYLIDGKLVKVPLQSAHHSR